MPLPLEKDIVLVGRAGFQGYDIWRVKLDKYLEKNTKGDLKKLLYTNGVNAASIMNMHVGWMYIWSPEEIFSTVLKELRHYLEIANYVDAERMLVCGDGYKDRNVGHTGGLQAHASRVSKIADLAKKYGVKITFEWYGHQGPLADAIEVVNMANNENLDLILDTYHWYKAGGDLNHIDRIPEGKLGTVHINDVESVPREELTDFNRTYPGFGILPLTKILEMLKKHNYNGYLSVEIIRREYWTQDQMGNQDPAVIARRSYESLLEVMKKASVL
jgi:sugar phosphate isomerase/epimerase